MRAASPLVAAPAALLAAALGLAAQDPVPADTLPDPLPTEIPFGLPAALAAARPPAELAALGRRLFFDPLLSIDGSVACASCHDPAHGFADPRPRSTGARGRTTLRHAPTLLNRALGESFLWDGRAATLEEQVLLPIEDEREMALPLEEAEARLADEYADAFAAVPGLAPDRGGLARALAAFVRTLLRGDAPVDRFRAGEVQAMTPAQRGGMWLFESRGGCWRCHGGPNFTDEGFHNTGVGAVDGVAEEGRGGVTGDPADRGRFKTPTLRGLADTAPYMHDGSLSTLRDVVEFYRRGGGANPHLDPVLRPVELTDEEVELLVAFLSSL